jgi:protein-disulfide isomerase
MDKTKWIIFAVLVVGIFGLIIWQNKSNEEKTSFKGDANSIITEGPIADQVYGSRDAKVVLIEYGDYQCPACGSMYQPVKDLTELYKDKLTFIFRNYPLTNIHPNALAASNAAEAAGLQGKFWEMHDKLYENQTAWSSVAVDKREAVFSGYASELGLDAAKFKTDLASADIASKVARDRQTGKDIFKANSTPTFVLNGTKLESSVSVSSEALRQKVEEALKQAYPDFKPATTTTAPPASTQQ